MLAQTHLSNDVDGNWTVLSVAKAKKDERKYIWGI